MRTYDEEVLSKEELPRDIGNDFGETVIEERKIKISAFPTPIIGNLVFHCNLSEDNLLLQYFIDFHRR
jgi:hypothetical protein